MFNTKEHYKMYKKGKTWIFASIVTVTLALGAFGGQTARADTSDATTTGEETATQESVEPAKQVTLSQQQHSQTPADTTVKEDTGATDTNTPSDGTKDPVAAPAKETTPAPDATNNSEDDTADKNGDADLPAAPAPDTDKAGATDDSKVTEKPAANAPVDQTNNEVTSTTDTQPVPPVNTVKKVNPRLRSMAAPTPTPAVTAAQPVAEAEESIDQWMPNTKLQAEVLRTLNNLSPNGKKWASTSDITQSDMLYLTSLNNKQITWINESTPYSLEGLQYATNLTKLSLIGLPQTGEGPFYGGITDISPLSDLTKLTDLDLSFNSISDISPIANLKNINYLQLHYNRISDFSSLNPSQYTRSFTYQNQQVTLPFVYVSNATRAADMPFQAYLPGGKLAQLVEGNSGMFIENYYTTPTDERYWMVLQGGKGTSDNNGGLTFTNLVNNGYLSIDEYQGIPIVPNQLAYYMVGKYTMDGGQNFIIVVQPYMIGNDAAPITVSYVDEQGKTLQDNSTVNGVVGNTFSIDAPTIAGYEVTGTPTVTGTFSDTAQTVTFVYKEARSSVTVHYQDEAGTTIQADTVASGQVGTAYDIAHPDITGYTYKETQGDAQGTYTDTPTEVTFVYTKNAGTVTPPVVTPDQTITVTVHYQTADGTTVAPDVLVTGKAGDTYTTSPAANVPDGYKLVTTPANASGTLGDSDFSVTYVYEKTGGDGDKVTPDTDKPTTKPTKPATKPATTQKTPAKKTQAGGQADALTSKRGGKTIATVAKGGAAAKVDLTAKTSTQANHPAVSKSAAADLPQTNSSEQTSPFWGVALLVAVLGVFGFKLKRKEP